jgi:hypothetical protein
LRTGQADVTLMYNVRSLSEVARQRRLSEGVVFRPGRFGSSRQEEAAARWVGCDKLGILNSAFV